MNSDAIDDGTLRRVAEELERGRREVRNRSAHEQRDSRITALNRAEWLRNRTIAAAQSRSR